MRTPFWFLALAPTGVAWADPPRPGPAPIPTPPPWPTPGPSVLSLPDPQQWAGEVFNQVLLHVVQGLSQSLHSLVGNALGSSLNIISQTPPAVSYASPTVTGLWAAVRAAALASLVLLAVWGGFQVLGGPLLGLAYSDALETLSRLGLAALLVATSLWWGQAAIDANNALCAVLGSAALPAWQQAGAPTQLLAEAAASLLYLLGGLLLVLQMLMRLALVDALLVLAPLGLAAWALPQTQSWARLWTATFVGAVFTQFVQVVVLKLGASLLTEVAPMEGGAALVSLVLGLAVIVLTLKVPGLLRGTLGDGGTEALRSALALLAGGPS